ncbi:glycoside hydrolase family 15 protein [Devosia sp. A449]
MADDPTPRGDAPGEPGISPTWTSSAKDMVSTALGSSRLWASFGHGIVNEVYWPSTGLPQIRDLGFIIAGPSGWIEVKRAHRYILSMPKAYVPLPKVVHEGDDYRLELEYLPHPSRDVLLVRYRLHGEKVKLYTLLAPHLAGERRDNTAWAAKDLSAQKGDVALCLQSDCGFSRTSAGYAGTSDGWQDFSRNGAMTWSYARASNGNVALTGELAETSGTLALSFAHTIEGARTLARASLAEDYGTVRQHFIDGWEKWGETLQIPYASPELRYQAELSAAVLKIHQDRTYAGSIIASLSVPWGSSHDSLGGYHLVWPRDAVEAALALMSVGQSDDALSMLAYLIGTQGVNGGWAQNYYPDGRSYWTGVQLDQAALPVVLVGKLRASGALVPSIPVEAMVRSAIGFVVRNGPVSEQDRWEENAGITAFTLSVAIVALVAAAEFLDPDERDYALSLADCWNERIEEWIYTSDGPLCGEHEVGGYYVRIAPPPSQGGIGGRVQLKNRKDGDIAADALVAMGYLYLVRTGLRRPDDPRILSTLKVTEQVLRADTPSGVSYYRYNGDGYGEHVDGAPYDGTGIGRPWPLLTGERGHYAVTAGEDPLPFLNAMTKMTGPGGLIPEQIWDTEAISERGLFPGKPTGGAMPLVWAHGEFLKLLAAHATGRPVELLDVVQVRYDGLAPRATTWHWRTDSPFERLPAGRDLLIESAEPFSLHFGFDGWQRLGDTQAAQNSFGMHGVRLTAGELSGAEVLNFTLLFAGREAQRGSDQRIILR